MLTRYRFLAVAGLITFSVTAAALATSRAEKPAKPILSVDAPASSLLPVAFTSYGSLAQLNTLYSDIDAIRAANRAEYGDELILPQGRVSKIGDNLLLLSYEGISSECGSLGCTLRGFSRGPSGYYLSINLTVGPDIRYRISGGEPSIFVCAATGEQVEWRRQGGAEFAPVPFPINAKPQTCDPE